ncbi:MAG: flavin reductase [Clostridia bacterium]|nr:flavin reductase [Clostridia bacterium]
MDAVKRRSAGTGFSLCVQPAFLIGTANPDGTANFAPITWVSAACGRGDEYLLVISMFGRKRTKENVLRTGRMSVNLVSADMLPLMDYFGTRHADRGPKDALPYETGRGAVLEDVPTLSCSRWVYECEVSRSVETGESTTFFCAIRNVQIDERLTCADSFDVNLTQLDPVIYSGQYHSIGRWLGRIGDFSAT